VCRIPLGSVDELSRSLFVERAIRLLKVHCKYHFVFDDEKGYCTDEEGCTETSSYEDLEKHQNQCGKALVSCKYGASCGMLRKHTLSSHELACPYRPDLCVHCQKNIPLNEMQTHLTICGMVPLNCDKCGESVLRKELEKHLLEACLEQEITCDFKDQGCSTKLLRKNLKEHLASDIVEHMAMMRTTFAEQLTSFKQDYEREAKVRDDKIRHLEKVVKDSETKIEWRLKNYSQLRKKSYIQSDKFDMAGFTWFIGVYADGDNPESKGFISIYLFLDVVHMPKGKSITLDYYIKFVNHRDPAESIKKEFKSVFPIKNGQGWGDRKALPNQMLEQNGFIKDDTLLIEAEISVKKLTWSV
jgi:hypothetical protein